jgi:hypothetical protein
VINLSLVANTYKEREKMGFASDFDNFTVKYNLNYECVLCSLCTRNFFLMCKDFMNETELNVAC